MWIFFAYNDHSVNVHGFPLFYYIYSLYLCGSDFCDNFCGMFLSLSMHRFCFPGFVTLNLHYTTRSLIKAWWIYTFTQTVRVCGEMGLIICSRVTCYSCIIDNWWDFHCTEIFYLCFFSIWLKPFMWKPETRFNVAVLYFFFFDLLLQYCILRQALNTLSFCENRYLEF